MVSLKNVPLKYNYLNPITLSNELIKGNFIRINYFDFPKAFYTVNHPKLLTKLQSYGIKGNFLKWIGDFITDICQYVRVNKKKCVLLHVSFFITLGDNIGDLYYFFIY